MTMLEPISTPHSADPRLRLERFLRIRQAEAGSAENAAPRPAVTLSREAGIGASTIAYELSAYLDSLDDERGAPGWVTVNATLLDTLIQHFGAASRASLGSDPHADTVSIVPIFGEPSPPAQASHPGPAVSPASAAIRSLCELGNAIVVGRGGHLATLGLDNVFRVRLVADRAQRIQALAKRLGVTDVEDAARAVDSVDDARNRYVQRHFNQAIDNPLTYDLILNLSDVPTDVAVHLIGDSLLEWSAARGRERQREEGESTPHEDLGSGS